MSNFSFNFSLDLNYFMYTFGIFESLGPNHRRWQSCSGNPSQTDFDGLIQNWFFLFFLCIFL